MRRVEVMVPTDIMRKLEIVKASLSIEKRKRISMNKVIVSILDLFFEQNPVVTPRTK